LLKQCGHISCLLAQPLAPAASAPRDGGFLGLATPGTCTAAAGLVCGDSASGLAIRTPSYLVTPARRGLRRT